MTRANRRCGILLLFSLAGTGHWGQAQEFARKAVLAPIPSTDFYQVPVTPALTNAAKVDLSDLRIVDNKQRQVPYLLRRSSMDLSRMAFTDYTILDIRTDSTRTVVELAGKGAPGTDRLSLVMGNTAVERYTSLSGSNDRQQWFAIDDRIRLHSTGADGSGSFVQTVHFPYCRYPYLKLVIHNGPNDPLNIQNAGVYTDEQGLEPLEWVYNPAPSFVQKDSSNGYTYLAIRHNTPYLVDRVLLQVSGPRFYKRSARLFELSAGGTRTLVAEASLSSEGEPALMLNNIKAQDLLLQVENGDNPPLVIERVLTAQVPRFLVTHLEKGVAYQLLAGNPEAVRPQYDLAQFADSIPAVLITLNYGPLMATATGENVLDWKDRNLWIWPAIVIMVIVLALLTYKLLAEMKRAEE